MPQLLAIEGLEWLMDNEHGEVERKRFQRLLFCCTRQDLASVELVQAVVAFRRAGVKL